MILVSYLGKEQLQGTGRDPGEATGQGLLLSRVHGQQLGAGEAKGPQAGNAQRVQSRKGGQEGLCRALVILQDWAVQGLLAWPQLQHTPDDACDHALHQAGETFSSQSGLAPPPRKHGCCDFQPSAPLQCAQ